MAIILGIQTVDNLQVISTNTDPRMGGVNAPIGSIALASDGSGIFNKVGILDTDWITNSISIPTPFIKLGVNNPTYKIQNLYAGYLPVDNNIFLQHQPKYYLFMAKSNGRHTKRVNGSNTTVRRPAGFYHPTHQNGKNFPSNSAYYAGNTQIPLDSEFDIATTPYTNTLIGFNPFQWTRYKDAGVWVVPDSSFFGNPPSSFKIQGKNNNKKYPRSCLFNIAIGIKNPDVTSKYPILFGQMSNVFRLSFTVELGLVVGFSLTIQNSSVKRNIL